MAVVYFTSSQYAISLTPQAAIDPTNVISSILTARSCCWEHRQKNRNRQDSTVHEPFTAGHISSTDFPRRAVIHSGHFTAEA
jgi:hypothetical protein